MTSADGPEAPGAPPRQRLVAVHLAEPCRRCRRDRSASVDLRRGAFAARVPGDCEDPEGCRAALHAALSAECGR